MTVPSQHKSLNEITAQRVLQKYFVVRSSSYLLERRHAPYVSVSFGRVEVVGASSPGVERTGCQEENGADEGHGLIMASACQNARKFLQVLAVKFA